MNPEGNEQKVLEARKAIMAAETDREKRVLTAVQAVREERRRKIALKGEARGEIERAMRAIEKAKEDRDESCRAAKLKVDALKEKLAEDEKSGEVSHRDLEKTRERILALKTNVKDVWEKGQIKMVEAEAELAEMKLHSFKIKADARAALRREKVALQDVRKEEERRFRDQTKAPRAVVRRALAMKIASPIFALGKRLKKAEEDFPAR